MEEKVLREIHPTRLAYLGSYLLGLGLTIVWIFLYFNPLDINLLFIRPYRLHTLILPLTFLAVIAVNEVRIRMETYTLTNFRLIDREGIINITESAVQWDRVADVYMEQNLLDRILDIGDITVQSIGGEGVPEIHMKKIRAPEELKALMNDMMMEWKGRG